MNSKKNLLKNSRLYAVTNITASDRGNIIERIKQAYDGGADIVQIRSKELADKELYELSLAVKKIAESRGKLLIVNDRIDIALAAGCDGVHLGQDDLPIEKARSILGKNFLIGVSTHNLEQARDAREKGADYIGVGPIYGTPTKPEYEAVSCELIREVKDNIEIPFVAIGGINKDNINDVVHAGAERVAVVRALFSDENVFLEAKTLKRMLIQKTESVKV